MPVLRYGRHRKPTKTARNAAAVATAVAISASSVATATAEELEPVQLDVGPTTQEIYLTPQHTVIQGETLSEIARDNGTDWMSLWDENRAVVSNPDLIFPGQQLTINGEKPIEQTQVIQIPSALKTAATQIEKSVPKITQGSSIVDAAKSYLGRGIQYVWGGKSTAGFDCSGFVWQVLKDTGHKVPYRTAAALQKWATPISKAEARPGDLVFWGSPAHHVEIYVGDGKTVGAANPQIDLGVHNLYGSPTFGRVPA